MPSPRRPTCAYMCTQGSWARPKEGCRAGVKQPAGGLPSGSEALPGGRGGWALGGAGAREGLSSRSPCALLDGGWWPGSSFHQHWTGSPRHTLCICCTHVFWCSVHWVRAERVLGHRQLWPCTGVSIPAFAGIQARFLVRPLLGQDSRWPIPAQRRAPIGLGAACTCVLTHLQGWGCCRGRRGRVSPGWTVFQHLPSSGKGAGLWGHREGGYSPRTSRERMKGTTWGGKVPASSPPHPVIASPAKGPPLLCISAGGLCAGRAAHSLTLARVSGFHPLPRPHCFDPYHPRGGNQ